MPTNLTAGSEVAREFLAQSGYMFQRLEKAEFEKETKHWVFTFDVGVTVTKLKKVTIDDSSEKIIGFE